MNHTVIVMVISFLGTCLGTIGGIWQVIKELMIGFLN